MYENNYVSTIVENQLPDFIRAEHPKFVALLKRYYEYLEQTDKTEYLAKHLIDYSDVDTTRADLVKYFKSKIIPNFPEENELSTAKIIKAAREFYTKKGTPDSFKFLFRVLYKQDIDVYFPKQDVFKASDGKWQLPQALRLAFTDTLTLLPNGNVNVSVTTANTVQSNGLNFITSNVSVNSYIQIGNQKRKVVNVNADTVIVEIPFINSNNEPTFVYNSQKLYKVALSQYYDFNVNLLEKRRGIGEVSRTTCVIERAVQSVDKETGREIVELYVTDVKRLFDAGENLIVDYVDENGDNKTFKSKIISLISNLSLYRNRFKVVQTGRKYKTGDPVVFYGGLADTPDATEAVAVVNNVSTGSIDSVSVIKDGYFFRDYDNTFVRILSSSGVGANVLVDSIWTDAGNSQIFKFNTDAIQYRRDLAINASEYDFDNTTTTINLTIGSGNTTTAVNLNTATFAASTVNDYYKSYVLKIVGGTGSAGSPNSATITAYNGTTKIATLGTALSVAPDATSNVKIFSNAQTVIGRSMTFENITLGKLRTLDLENGGAGFEEPPTFELETSYETDFSLDQGYLNIPSGNFTSYNRLGIPYPSIRLIGPYSLANGFYTGAKLFLDTGATSHYAKVVDYIVTNHNTSANVKTVYLDRSFENNINATNIVRFNLFMDLRPNVRMMGKLGAIEILKSGSGYTQNSFLEFIGTGYSANANVAVDGNGGIVGVTLQNRGEGYSARPTIRVRNPNGTLSAGANAEFQVYLLSDGEQLAAETSDIGRIQDFRIINRGFDYANTPLVSLKVVDVLTDNLSSTVIVLEGDTVWQGGNTNSGATFQGLVDASYRADTTNTVIRVFNYSGSIDTNLPLKVNTTTGNVTVNISTQNAIISFADVYDAQDRKYPFYYGNGLAKANAEFLRGLIKYSGFYLNSDGFPSADKKIQDDNYYHNFSYELTTEKSLDDYKETVYSVAHPAGMQLLSKLAMKGFQNNQITLTTNVHTMNIVAGTNANTNYSSNILYGNSSNFTTRTNVGDIIVINTTETATQKRYSRLITNVVNNNTLWLESPIGGLGDGRMRLSTGNANVKVYSNVYAVTESIETSDLISINVNGTIYNKQVVAITGNTVQLNDSIGLVNANVLYKKIPSYNVIAYEIIRTNQ